MINLIKKFRGYFNKIIFRTPGVEFFRQNKSIESKKKYINFWLKKARKNESLKKYFFTQKLNNESEITYKIKDDKYIISKDMFLALSETGLLIIENALPNFEKNLIMDHFAELKNNSTYKKNWLKIPQNPNFFTEVKEIMGPISIKHFNHLNNYSKQLSKEIYGKVVEPTVEFRYLKQTINCREKKTRGATFLHTDRFLPHFKVYYTPHAITINDAPLEYVISSHKINNDFINFYLNAKNFDETDEDFKKFKLKKKLVCVPENSLYVAFTNGFHRRVEFSSENERSLVFLQYVERFNKLDYLI
jgi:hypothetical protein